MGFGRFLITDPDGQWDSAIRECVQTVCGIRVFLGETEGPFLGANLRSELPSSRQRLASKRPRGSADADYGSGRAIRPWKSPIPSPFASI